MADTFTLSDGYALQRILEAAQQGRRVALVRDDGDPLRGTARFIGTRDGMSARASDVRDLFLRVTLDTSGVDSFWPVSELIDAGESFIVLQAS